MSRYIDQDKVIDAMLNLDTSNRVSWRDAVIDMIDAMPSADVQPDTKELIAKIKNGISATNADDVYSCGMRNGMRWVLSLIDGKEPSFELARNAADVQPVVHCRECIWLADIKDIETGELYHTCGVLGFDVPDGFACNQGKRKGADE